VACFSSQNRNADHQCLLATCIVSHNGSTCLLWYASQYLRILIEDWSQECSLPSLTWTRLMSLVSTLETLCIHSSKLQQFLFMYALLKTATAASERNKQETLGCFVCFRDNNHYFQEPPLPPRTYFPTASSYTEKSNVPTPLMHYF
jgi:hypothetical protein